jgi:hypothetical protein
VRLTFALLLLGSLITSASAAGTDMHLLADPFPDAHASAQQQSRPPINAPFSRSRYFGRGRAGFEE